MQKYLTTVDINSRLAPEPGTPLRRFIQLAEPSAAQYSRGLRQAGGVPARHDFLRIFVTEPTASAHLYGEHPAADGFQVTEANADYDVFDLSGSTRERSLLDWVHRAVREMGGRFGWRLDILDEVHRSVVTGDGSGLRRFDEEARAARGRARVAPAGMSVVEFWSLIDLLEGHADDDGCGRVIARLAQLSQKKIVGFEEVLQDCLALIGGDQYAEREVRDAEDPPGAPAMSLSDDAFLYARCAVVASGRDTWRRLAEDPAEFAGIWDLGAERLLFVAPTAFEKRTGRPWDYGQDP